MRTSQTVAIVIAALLGCSVEADPKPEDLAATVAGIRQRMHVRYAGAKLARIAIAHGDLELARAQARLVAAQGEPDLLPEWKPFIANVQVSATAIADAKDTVAASRAFAALGKQCAACHAAVPAKIVFADIAVPRPATSQASAMAEHEWATSLMWEGLIGPAPDRWNSGAEMLQRARLTIVAEADVGTKHLGLNDDIARVRTFATKARAAKTTDERAQIYGDLLATCAHCHQTIRDR